MKITSLLTDDSVLQEIGGRLAAARLAANLTQAALAEQAGVSKRTVERLENGEVSTRLSGFVRICRTLGLMEHIDRLVPEASVSPMQQLKRQGSKRQRASSALSVSENSKKWTWGDEG